MGFGNNAKTQTNGKMDPDGFDTSGREAQADPRFRKPSGGADPRSGYGRHGMKPGDRVTYEKVDRAVEKSLKGIITLMWNSPALGALIIDLVPSVFGVYAAAHYLGLIGALILGITISITASGLQMNFYREAEDAWYAIRHRQKLSGRQLRSLLLYLICWLGDNALDVMGLIYIFTGFNAHMATSFDFSSFDLGLWIIFVMIMAIGLSSEQMFMNRLRRGGLVA